MAEIPIASLKALASELNALEIDYAFTGGSIVGLLLDNPDLTPMRPTDDVDVIVEVLSRKNYPRVRGAFEGKRLPQRYEARSSYVSVDLQYTDCGCHAD